MATLYSQADSNIRKTFLLLFVFLLLIIGFGFVFSQVFGNANILYFAVGFSVLTSFFSYWFSDKLVLAMTRAKEATHENNRELYHLVENLCIAGGLKMPKIYIMPESQPNAFATGRNQEHAVVALTEGLLQKLNKTEIEGVIAHELSHIKNKDMLLQTMVVVLAGVIAILADMFLRITFRGGFAGRGNRDSKSQAQVIFMLIGLVAAILAPIAATLLRLAISRKREFLADASGALLTRYPEGLAMALEKISNDPSVFKHANNSTAHLFIANPFRGKQSQSWFTKLFLTHPSTEERIAALRGLKV